MIQTDIFTIATSGLNAQQGMLNTTANNIANVNTEGYIRQRGSLESQAVGGVLLSDVERIVDRFAQEQLQRDTSDYGESNEYLQKLNQLDNIFASEAISAAEGMSRYFAALNTATDDPNSVSGRQVVLGQAEAMVGQFNNLNDYLTNKVESANDELSDKITQANDLVQQIAELNTEIKATQFSPQTSGSEAVKNTRDQAILQLSELVGVTTRPNGDGSTLVFMETGQALVLEDGSFNLFSANGNPDPNFKALSLVETGSTSTSPVTIPLGNVNIGGELGGLVRYRDDVLEPNRREMGQIALSLTDAMNEQNKLGMDLDGELGGDLFTIPQFSGLPYTDNLDSIAGLNARMPDGSGSQITNLDYRVTVDAVTGNIPTDFTVTLMNPDGTEATDSSGNLIQESITGITAGAGTFHPLGTGSIGNDLEFEFPGTNYQAGDQFLVQPAKEAAGNIAMATNRPEDLALASPIRVESELSNLGSASVSSISVSNTFVDNTNADPASSAFDGAGGLQTPGNSPDTGGLGAPARIVFTAADSFEVQDSAGTVITTVNGATSLQNLLSQAEAVPWDAEFTALDDYPGYDLSIEGVPQAGDTFNINFNTDGFNDNTNGLALSALQDADTTLQSGNGNGTLITFHEAYTSIVSDVGTKTASAQVEFQAAQAMQRQSEEWVNSVSGVNLDEEAADLIRFQQAYSASARVLTTAQSLFQTILSAVG